MKMRTWLLAVIFVIAYPLSSHGALINITGSFNASGFPPNTIGGTAAPFDPVSGTFDFTYDDSNVGSAIPATLNSLNIVIGPTTHNASNSLADVSFTAGVLSAFRIGGSNLGMAVQGGIPDFFLAGFDFANLKGVFQYSTAATNGIWRADDSRPSNGTTSISFTSSPVVPTPSAMLLMGTGLFGLVGWRWWSTKNA